MNNNQFNEILTLLKDEENSDFYIFEIYHAILEYIKSGNAISDMGHPDFNFGAQKDRHDYHYTSYRPSLSIFKLAKSFSKYLNQFDINLIWYRDLSTWEKFCKFILELHQINYFKKNFHKVIKSHKHYITKTICPACGLKKYYYRLDLYEKIFVTNKDNLIYVDCRRCGKFVIPYRTFKYLDTIEKKAKLFVYLTTRNKKNKTVEIEITPNLLNNILNTK